MKYSLPVQQISLSVKYDKRNVKKYVESNRNHEKPDCEITFLRILSRFHESVLVVVSRKTRQTVDFLDNIEITIPMT